jgi:hypothetical protein
MKQLVNGSVKEVGKKINSHFSKYKEKEEMQPNFLIKFVLGRFNFLADFVT